jgi:3-deoxy-manno-octulosonate cytidylyltransferase (CMP-KDO synthetase)
MKTICVIPARYGSTRFPGKPLAVICGKPLIQRVYDQVKKAVSAGNIVIATDDDRIFKAASKFCRQVVMTSPGCPSGTDRVAEAVRKIECDVVVNVQGDEPVVSPLTIKKLIRVMELNKDVVMATPVRKFKSMDEINSDNSAKVVIDKDENALFFSRYLRPGTLNAPVFKHIGLYAYRKEFLLKLVRMPVSKLEKFERLEQLRVLENGYKIRTVLVNSDSVPVDVPEDIKKVELILSKLI